MAKRKAKKNLNDGACVGAELCALVMGTQALSLPDCDIATRTISLAKLKRLLQSDASNQSSFRWRTMVLVPVRKLAIALRLKCCKRWSTFNRCVGSRFSRTLTLESVQP